jgi:hypothetical protein
MVSLDQTDYAMDDGVCFPAEAGISLLIMTPILLWALPGLLSNGYKGPFLRGKSARALSLPHPYLVPRLNAWSDTSSPPRVLMAYFLLSTVFALIWTCIKLTAGNIP